MVQWVRRIQTVGLGSLYGGTDGSAVAYGPVMAYIWAALGAIEPGFRTAVDASDEGLRTLLKLPATAADLGLALLVAYALREHRYWAVLAATAVLVHPAIAYTSAWWGQADSIYVLSALGALIAALRGRTGLAAALLAVSLATKPQAIMFLVPFVAWWWATGGPRELARAATVGLVVTILLWVPFIGAGGPVAYLATLTGFHAGVYNALSIQAWNPWFLLQELVAPGKAVSDGIAVIGPLTARQVGYAVTAAISAWLALRVLRDPTPRTLILAVATNVLVFFTFMTQMHERYAYAAVIILVLLIAEPSVRWLWVALGAVVTLNVLAVAPPTEAVGSILAVGGPVALVGSVATLVITVLALLITWAAPPDSPSGASAGVPFDGSSPA